MAVKTRVRISAAFNKFNNELQKLSKFNSRNINLYNEGHLNQSQIDLLVESVFFNSFRHYENYIREAFLLCCIGNVVKRPKIVSYLNAINFEHSEKLIKSTSSYLDWAHPDKLISRAELFLLNGHPFKIIISTHRATLLSYKRIRNHIAHDSIESLSEYKKILVSYYGTLPLNIPSVGKYLLEPSKTIPAVTLLDDFFSIIRTIATNLST